MTAQGSRAPARLPHPRLPPIIVSDHALGRARYRFDWPTMAWQDVHRDVSEAIVAGRVAKTLRGTGAARAAQAGGNSRRCWTADGCRVYLIGRRRRPESGKQIWVVITAVKPLELAA